MIHPCEIIEVTVRGSFIHPISGSKKIRIFKKESPDVIHIKNGDFIIQNESEPGAFRTVESIGENKFLTDPPQGTGEYFITYAGDKLTEGKALVWLDKPLIDNV